MTGDLSSIHGTVADPTSGYTLVEQYLEKQYLANQTFESPLAQTSYASKLNLPKRAGQYVKFTRRGHGRMPEAAVDGADPESGGTIPYEQINVPIEFIDDYIPLTTIAQMTSWLDLAKDAKELIFEAVQRYQNRAVQAAFLQGRYAPGRRNSSGLTTGTTPYFHYWTTAQQTVTMYGQSFVFQKAPSYFATGRANFAGIKAADRFKMDDFRRARVRLANAGAPKVNGKYVAVISEAIKADLEIDDEYFQAAIRNPAMSKSLLDGQIADYAGMHWVLDDEPFTMNADAENVFAAGGSLHVAQVFGQDSFGRLNLGGEASAKPTFKVQDVSKTGSLMTIGYLMPFQTTILNPAWAANLIGPVSEPSANG